MTGRLWPQCCQSFQNFQENQKFQIPRGISQCLSVSKKQHVFKCWGLTLCLRHPWQLLRRPHGAHACSSPGAAAQEVGTQSGQEPIAQFSGFWEIETGRLKLPDSWRFQAGKLETGHGGSVHTTDTSRGYGSSHAATSTPQPWPLVNPLLPIPSAFRPQMPSPLWLAWPFLPHKQGPLPCNDHGKEG